MYRALGLVLVFVLALEYVNCQHNHACNETSRDQESNVQKKNYYFVPRQMTWMSAVKHCQRNCSALATIRNHIERLQFYIQISERMNGRRVQPWLGGKCEHNHDCKWWNTGDHVTSRYHRWQPREPDTVDGEFKCMTMAGDVEDHWSLARCTGERPFACQYFTRECDDE